MSARPIILAFETSIQPGSVALALDDTVFEEELPSTQSTASAILPVTDQLLSARGLSPSDVNVIAVSIGPGSFTGLRIAVVIAKLWSYTLGTRVIAVPTTEILAAQVPVELPRLWVLLDAQRRELFAQLFIASQHTWQPTQECRLMRVEQWRAASQTPCQVVGPGWRRVAQCPSEIPPGVLVTLGRAATPRAATLARLAQERARLTHFDDPWTLLPLYIRPSGAEENLGLDTQPVGNLPESGGTTDHV